MARHFDAGEWTELALGLGLFHGFSKMLIALGLEPDQMDTTVLPTPQATGADVPPPDFDDPVVALLAPRPDLAAPWQHMARCLDALPDVDPRLLAAARRRLAELIGVAELAPRPAADDTDEEHHGLVVELAELFAIDVRAIDVAHRDRLRQGLGEAGLVGHIMNLAVYDGMWRVAACRVGAPA
ncbi:MAG: hypothetical protein ACE367_20040 [Acidimicrobiales bacterium]